MTVEEFISSQRRLMQKELLSGSVTNAGPIYFPNNITKIGKELVIVQEKLQKYEQLLLRQDIMKIRPWGGSSKTQALHEEGGIELIEKVDPSNTPKEITVYHTTENEKALKDNHIKGLVTVKINRKTLKCSYHTKDDSCIHIKYALEDDRFARRAYLKNIKNPLLQNKGY